MAYPTYQWLAPVYTGFGPIPTPPVTTPNKAASAAAGEAKSPSGRLLCA